VANPTDTVAVLYRTNFQSRQIEEALRRYGRTYSVVGGFSFYQRAEIKDTVAYLKLLSWPGARRLSHRFLVRSPLPSRSSKPSRHCELANPVAASD